jgi:hypothetical protein
MSKIWKYLDVPNHQEISDEVYQYIADHTDVLLGKNYLVDQPIYQMLNACPLLSNFLISRDLTPKRLAIIVCLNEDIIPRHRDTDGADPDSMDPHVRILWPVKNCQGSKTQIWKAPVGAGESAIDSNGVLYTELKDQECEFVEEFELSSPVLFDASCIHSVQPNANLSGPRVSFTIGFDRDLPISKSVKAWFGFQR